MLALRLAACGVRRLGGDVLTAPGDNEDLFPMQRLADPPPAVYAFPGSVAAPLSEVGGKGLSLIKAAQAGLPVPPGFVLPVGFFAPWLAELKASRRWADFLKAAPQDLQRACDALKRVATALPFTDEQTGVLSAALASWGAGTRN